MKKLSLVRSLTKESCLWSNYGQKEIAFCLKQLMFNESPTRLGIRDQRDTAIIGQDLSLPAPPLEKTISTEISDEEEVGVV